MPLPENAIDRLRELAKRELRDPRTQAAYMIVSGLRGAGMDPERVETKAAPASEPAR